MPMTVGEPPLQCPRCRRPLAPRSDREWACTDGHGWPVVAGVLDCRSATSGFDMETDREIAEDLYLNRHLDFDELLRRYWARLSLPPHLVERHVRGDLIGEARSSEVADQIEDAIGREMSKDIVALEVGAGTGALGAEMSPKVGWVVVSDISLAWLVLAGKRLESMSVDNVTVVAATATNIPYPPQTFDIVVAADVIEHVPDVGGMIAECMRVARPGGRLWASTPNRFSLTPEPHVRVWGVGFLPRRWAGWYVQAVRGVDYDGIRTLSLLDLRRLGRTAGLRVSVNVPEVPTTVLPHYSATGRALIRVFNRLRQVPPIHRLLLPVSPYFHLVVSNHDTSE